MPIFPSQLNEWGKGVWSNETNKSLRRTKSSNDLLPNVMQISQQINTFSQKVNAITKSALIVGVMLLALSFASKIK